MRTNFSWLLGSATVACAAVGSVVATLWLLGLGPSGTESGVLQAGPDSRPAVFRAEALPRPHRAVPRRKPPVAQRLRAAHAPVRVQLPHVRSALAPVHVTPSTEAPHVAIRPQVVVSAPVPAPVPARPSVPALPTPVAPPAPAVPTPPATPAPQPTTPEPVPGRAGRARGATGRRRDRPDGPEEDDRQGRQERRAVQEAGVAALPDTRAGPADPPRRRPRRRRQLEAEARLLRAAGEGRSPRQAQGRLMNAHGH